MLGINFTTTRHRDMVTEHQTSRDVRAYSAMGRAYRRGQWGQKDQIPGACRRLSAASLDDMVPINRSWLQGLRRTFTLESHESSGNNWWQEALGISCMWTGWNCITMAVEKEEWTLGKATITCVQVTNQFVVKADHLGWRTSGGRCG